MKNSEQKRIRDDERRIVAALRSGGTISGLKAEETVTQVKLLMAQGRLVFEKVSPRAHEAPFSNRALRNRFLASKSACAAFIMSIDIRRSAELMLNARSMELFGEFMAGLCEELKVLICDRFGIVDKFTGDGLVASFPEFFSGPDAGYRAISAAHEAHLVFTKRYKQHRSSSFTVLTDIGLGIGIDWLRRRPAKNRVLLFLRNTEVQKQTQLMEPENLNIKEVIESRRHAVEESLRTISVDELKALTDELFPYADHPWLETFLNVVSDPTSGSFHHAVTDDRIQILYCHDKEIGMWFIRGSGKGPLQPEELKIMKEIVEAGR